jgi:hypothetical protein
MQGMAILGNLLGAKGPTHRPLGIDRNSVMEAVRRMQLHALIGASQGPLALDLRSAMAQGRDIQQIGCAPATVLRTQDGGWKVDVHLRLELSNTLLTIALVFDTSLNLVSAVQTSTSAISPAGV